MPGEVAPQHELLGKVGCDMAQGASSVAQQMLLVLACLGRLRLGAYFAHLAGSDTLARQFRGFEV